jgi:non-specific serine/threonine protein kinase
MAQLKQLLVPAPSTGSEQERPARLVTLTGPGGAGKSRLALQTAAELLDAFPNGVWLVELAPQAAPALVPETVIAALGLQNQSGDSTLTFLADYLRDKKGLLILDNCEHVIAASAQLADILLRGCPQVQLLATSREALGLAGERPFRVPSLAAPDPRHLPPLEALSHYEAIRLFVERAATALPGFVLTEANAAAVAQICLRLDGIPLAIELAAARVQMLRVEQIVGRLDNHFRLLTGGSRTVLPRQQTMRALIDWSYHLLNELERALLRRLSVFAGGWTLEAAEAVGADKALSADEVLDVLAQLVNKSLVVAEREQGAETRYRLLETLRQYGREKLLEAGEDESTRQRHLAYFLHLAEVAEPELRRAGQREWLARLEAEHNNLRSALDWALETDVETGLRLAGALHWFWHLCGHFREGYERLEKLLAVNPGGATLIRARALAAAGALVGIMDDPGAAVTLCEQSIALYRDLGNEEGMAFPLGELGWWVCYDGDYRQAQALSEESLALFKKTGDKWGIRTALNPLGIIALAQGDFERAAAAYQESLVLSREIGDKDATAFALYLQGGLAYAQGDDGRALALYEESLSIAQETGIKPTIAYVIMAMGLVALQGENYEQAGRLLGESLELQREMGAKIDTAITLSWLGQIARIRQDYPRAAALYGESLALLRQFGNKISLAICLSGLAVLAATQGQPTIAARLLGAAEAAVPDLRTGVIWVGIPFVRPADYEQVNAAIRAQLDEVAFKAAWAEGQAMTVEQAVAYALDYTNKFSA